jgi:hypothetical protein
MKSLVTKSSASVTEITSLASKLLHQTMVVEHGRLYVCGLFAATRLVAAGRFELLANTLRHRRGAPKRNFNQADDKNERDGSIYHEGEV